VASRRKRIREVMAPLFAGLSWQLRAYLPEHVKALRDAHPNMTLI
jgi:hypothetical protein